MSYGIRVTDGTVSAPHIAFANDTDSGFYRIGANNVGLALAGAKVVDFAATGVAVTGTLAVSGASTFSGNVQARGTSLLAEWTDGTDVLTLKANSGTQGHFQYRTACVIHETSAGEVGRFSGGILAWGTTDVTGGVARSVILGNVAAAPTVNPVGGGILYVEAGALKYRGTSGTITTLGAA